MNNNESLKVKDIYDNASDGFGSVVMDMQENLLKAVTRNAELQNSIALQIKIFGLLKIKQCLTEQVPEKLGATSSIILNLCKGIPVFEKCTFSAFGCDQFREWLNDMNISHLLISGIETPICIYQTCLDALRENLQVTVISDCVGARRQRDAETILAQLSSFGCSIIPLETICYSLLKDSAHAEFKSISNLVRERD